LDAGADDYITKPFGIEELLARVRANLRPAPTAENGQALPIEIGDFRIDLAAHKVAVRGREVHLTPKEFDLNIVPVRSKANVTASIQESTTVTVPYTAKALLGPMAPGTFVTAIWDDSDEQDASVVVSLGTDCAVVPEGVTPCTDPNSLHTKVGWDNVTGLGTPNAQAFADAFKPAP